MEIGIKLILNISVAASSVVQFSFATRNNFERAIPKNELIPRKNEKFTIRDLRASLIQHVKPLAPSFEASGRFYMN